MIPTASQIRVVAAALPLVGVGLATGASPAAAADDPPAYAPVAGSPWETGELPADVAFGAGGHLLATVNESSNDVSMFTVAPGGELTPAGTFATGSTPVSLAFSGTGLLAVANVADGTVSVFRVDPVSGNLTPFGASPYSVADAAVTTGAASAVAFGPSGELLVVADAPDEQVVLLRVDPAAGTAVPAGTYPVDGDVRDVAFSAGGRFLAAANGEGDSVTLFSADTGAGSLTEVVEVSVGNGPQQVVFGASGLLAVIGGGNTVVVYRVDDAGAVTEFADPVITGVTGVAFEAAGERIGVATVTGMLVYEVPEVSEVAAAAGVLRLLPGAPYGPNAYAVAFRADGVMAAVGGEHLASVFAPNTPVTTTQPPLTGSSPAATTATGSSPPATTATGSSSAAPTATDRTGAVGDVVLGVGSGRAGPSAATTGRPSADVARRSGEIPATPSAASAVPTGTSVTSVAATSSNRAASSSTGGDVEAAPPTGGPELSRTGVAVHSALITGLALLLAGGLMLMLGRLRSPARRSGRDRWHAAD